MQHDKVSHRDAIADVEGQSNVCMEDTIILNTDLVANANRGGIAAQGGARPYTGTLANNDVADDLGAGIDVCGWRDCWREPAEITNHDRELSSYDRRYSKSHGSRRFVLWLLLIGRGA